MPSKLSEGPSWLFFDDFETLLKDHVPIIDVRASVEFASGRLPHSANLPILIDIERASVGTCYKERGSAAAEALGYDLVSGDIRSSRVKAWVDAFNEKPHSVLTCFRGGKRSEIAQQWLGEQGVEVRRVRGGYKAVRQYLLPKLDLLVRHPITVVAGPTGAGKTRLIHRLAHEIPTLDLEGLAKHRGSAFGPTDEPQPAQATFENFLCAALVHLNLKSPQISWIVEDESPMIGSVVLPGGLFENIETSQMVVIDEPLAFRVQNTFNEYIINSPLTKTDVAAGQRQFRSFEESVKRISRKLGGALTQEILHELAACEADYVQGRSLERNLIWIEGLLRTYYDPLYHRSVERKKHLIRFRGDTEEAWSYLRETHRSL